MIIVESKRKIIENILKKYPEAIIAYVTSNAKGGLVKLSPFYPHGGIPLPFSDGVDAECVKGIWQGLKVFENEGIDRDMLRNNTMKNIKRTVRTHGRVLGHHKGVYSSEIWEFYYNKAEESAKKLGGMVLDKFYDEGSFATIAAFWKQNNNTCSWMTYSDSVVFHYDYASKKLTHSFISLADFSKAPYLINCKDELGIFRK